MNLFELRRLEKVFKEQGTTGCWCNEVSHLECPDHISTAIEAKIRYGNVKDTMIISEQLANIMFCKEKE